MKIYFAGPLFTTAEQDFNESLVALLRAAGHEVWLPQETEQRDATSNLIFKTDVAGIEWCDVLIGNMDGPDPDSGTCWEVGACWNRKPVILYRTDIREEGPPFGPYNLMLHQAANGVIDCKWHSTAAIAEKLLAALHSLPAPGAAA
jgi:nucleoside 2-deoxyribosyltransferase